MHLEPLDGENVFVIHDLLTARECEELIARSEALGYEAAAVGGELLPQLRNNGRAFLEDPALAAELWQRACPLHALTSSGRGPRVSSACANETRIRPCAD